MARCWLALVLVMACVWPSASFGQSTDTLTTEKVVGTVLQQQWLAATPQERVRLAEARGEDGARAMAKAKGYVPVFDGFGRMLPQGPDQVYRAPRGGIIVYEAKGGTGQLGYAYGFLQGSSEWAVEAAKRVLRSSRAGQSEKTAAREILNAAARGQLEVHVVRTSHVLGEPAAAVLEGTAKTTDGAMLLARSAIDDLAKGSSQFVDDAVRSSDDLARASAEGSSLLRATSKVAVPVAVAVDAGFRVRSGMETERQYAADEITAEQREVTHARNAAGMVGGWTGAWAGAELGAMGGGVTGSAVAPGPGTFVGGVVGGLAGGVAGYCGGEVAAEAAAEWTVNQVHAAGTTIASSAEGVWDATVDTAKSAATGVNSAWNWLWGN